MRLGYARCSRDDQDLGMQTDALEKAGCERIFSEHASGRKSDRPELLKLLDHLREADTVVVYKMDRISRSMRDMISIAEQVQAVGADFISLNDPGIDTTTPMGKFFFHVIAALSQLEADVTSQRTKDGLAAAKARGRNGGRPPALTPEKKRLATRMLADGETVAATARAFGVSRKTIQRSTRGNGRICAVAKLSSKPQQICFESATLRVKCVRQISASSTKPTARA